jgi:hypothetical protein
MLSAVKSPSTGANQPADQSWACERLAERLHTQGFVHPVAAAVALAARGHAVADVASFAIELGVDVGYWRRLEAGEVPYELLPAVLRRRASAIPLDLVALAAVERRLAQAPPPPRA